MKIVGWEEGELNITWRFVIVSLFLFFFFYIIFSFGVREGEMKRESDFALVSRLRVYSLRTFEECV